MPTSLRTTIHTDVSDDRNERKHEPFLGSDGSASLEGRGVFFLLLFFTNERVKAGLANARAKGKLIGRKKVRDSDLIRKLLRAGMTFRQIAQIAKCSHGSVWAEKSAMRKEEKTLPAPVDETIFPEISQTTKE